MIHERASPGKPGAEPQRHSAPATYRRTHVTPPAISTPAYRKCTHRARTWFGMEGEGSGARPSTHARAHAPTASPSCSANRSRGRPSAGRRPSCDRSAHTSKAIRPTHARCAVSAASNALLFSGRSRSPRTHPCPVRSASTSTTGERRAWSSC